MSITWTRDRGTLLTAAALLAVTLAAWAGIVYQSLLSGMAGMEMDTPTARAAAHVSLLAGLGFALSWLVMMASMMLPSALPMVLLYRTVARGETSSRYGSGLATPIFVAGYLLVWTGVGVLVYLAQVAVTAAAERSQVLAAGLPLATAAVLALAGLYQFTPLTSVCLTRCRSPLDFLMHRYRRGPRGALQLGLEHGAYCLGCCWGLMAVLVAAGAMGLAWVAVITLVVFAEKLLPRGEAVARLVGAILLSLGAAVAVQPDLGALLHAAAMGGR